MAAGIFGDDKLEGNDDWWEWKYNMKLQLKATKLWSHVDSTATIALDVSNDRRTIFELGYSGSGNDRPRLEQKGNVVGP